MKKIMKKIFIGEDGYARAWVAFLYEWRHLFALFILAGSLFIIYKCATDYDESHIHYVKCTILEKFENTNKRGKPVYYIGYEYRDDFIGPMRKLDKVTYNDFHKYEIGKTYVFNSRTFCHL